MRSSDGVREDWLGLLRGPLQFNPIVLPLVLRTMLLHLHYQIGMLQGLGLSVV